MSARSLDHIWCCWLGWGAVTTSMRSRDSSSCRSRAELWRSRSSWQASDDFLQLYSRPGEISLSTTNAYQIAGTPPGSVCTLCRASVDSSRVLRSGESLMMATRDLNPSASSTQPRQGKRPESGISSRQMQSCNRNLLEI